MFNVEQKIQWDSPDPKDFSQEAQVTVYIASLVKETCNLYKVTTKFLPMDTVRWIMSSIFATYNKRLELELNKVDFFTSSGKTA